jgi:hypothetical protein
VKDALARLVSSLGLEVRKVSGARLSNVQDQVDGVGSVLPAASTARTTKVWGPSSREEEVKGVGHFV